VCGHRDQKLLRILPFKVRLFGERCPISSVNTDEQQSFGSSGKDQLGNSPICMACAGSADRVLRFMLQLDDGESSGRHAVVLAYDDSPKKSQPLRNQIAVFWTKALVTIPTPDEPRPVEDIPRAALGDIDEPLPEDQMPAYAAQLRDLLERPLKQGKGDSTLPVNRFYLSVLSPNKSRLVVREWLEQDVDAMRQHVRRYLDALRVLHPSGRYVGFPPLPAMLAALQSPVSSSNKNDEKPRLPQAEPDLTRKLLRCMFTGSLPPAALLTRAVRCFRVPDPLAEGEQRRRQELRRMNLAAAMKLFLTYDKSEKEQRAMEERHTEYDDQSDYKRQSPYLAGCLLAVLEAIQSRPGTKVNTTLVDRFYGAASTAPATVFANLINMATKAHLPKLRREGKESFTLRSGKRININDRIAENCAAINNAGGFRMTLTPEEQAQFALGFYAERAELKPPPKP
jgi:CRISPR-associated protein Csd1